MSEANPFQKTRSGQGFTETRWTHILMAQSEHSPSASEALEDLCTRYWPAIYTFLRRRGYSPHDAEDLTQGFFSNLLETRSIARADRDKGRFRSFLLGALQHYLVDEARKRTALKRGGPARLSNLPFGEIEQRYLSEPDPGLTPEEVFDRRWAASLLERAMQLLQSEFDARGQSERFKLMKRFLAEEANDRECAALAGHLKITSKSASVAVARLRGRYRELIREELLATVSGPEMVTGEFRDLFGLGKDQGNS